MDALTWARTPPGPRPHRDNPTEAQTFIFKPQDGHSLTPCCAFTTSVTCEINGPYVRIDDLKPMLHAGGTLKVINSNAGCESLEGYKDKSQKTPKNPTRIGKGVCFAEAMELQFEPEADSWLGKKLKTMGREGKVYQIQMFPSTGQVQIVGCLFPETMEDARWAVDELLTKLQETGIPPGGEFTEYALTKDLYAVSKKYNTGLIKANDRVVFNLRGLVRALELETNLPYPLESRIMHAVESQDIMFKFKTPLSKPLIKIYGKGSINILSSKTKEEIDRIFTFLDTFILANWETVVGVIPQTDEEVAGLPNKAILNIPALKRGTPLHLAYDLY